MVWADVGTCLDKIVGQNVESAVPTKPVSIARFYRSKAGLTQREFSLTGALDKCDGYLRLKAALSICIQPGVRVEQPLRLHDLVVVAFQPMVDAFWRPHANAKKAAWPNVGLTRRYRKTARCSLPMLQVLGVGPTSEN